MRGSINMANLSDADRAIARVVGGLSVLLLGALTVSGVWQFFMHEADSSWSGHQLGSGRFQQLRGSTGIAEAHAAVADLAGILALFVLAWVSARVIYKVSWLGIGILLVVIGSMITGTLIRFNAVFTDGVVDTDATGYSQFFLGSVDGAVTDRYELGSLSIVFWTIVHILSIPILIAASWLTIQRSQRRAEQRRADGPRWLDGIEAKRSEQAWLDR